MEGEGPKRSHRKAQAGSKFKKKQENAKKKAGLDNHRHNPKAFTHSGGVVSTRRKVQRSAEIEQKRAQKDTIDKTPDIPPPYVIAVQGPPGVGKSTLIRSLVKHYTKHNISDVNGPITVVSGRNRRITFIECPNNMQQMIDVAKIADLVLLLADGSFGFEMETFEFLNIMQTHGFPRVMGILTHLDGFRDNKTLRKTKKKLKSRFWTEIYDGAKLFYLSGLQYGRYNKTEIKNLSRFLAVQKFMPLTFRSAHPYVVALRMEDQTHADDVQQDPNCPRTINLYGYVKGARMREGQMVHIPGAGDFPIRALDDFVDPCPAPQAEISPEKRKKSNETGSRLLRTLKDNQRAIYAPGCDVGNVQLDADAMYIHIPEHQMGFTRPERLQLQAGADASKLKLATPSATTAVKRRRQYDNSTPENDADDVDGLGLPGVSHGDDDGEYLNDEDAALYGKRLTTVPEAVKMVHALQDARGALAKARSGALTLLPGGAVVSEGQDVFEGRNEEEDDESDFGVGEDGFESGSDDEDDLDDDSDYENGKLKGDKDRNELDEQQIAAGKEQKKSKTAPWKARGSRSAEEAADSLDEDDDDESDEEMNSDNEEDDDEEEEENDDDVEYDEDDEDGEGEYSIEGSDFDGSDDEDEEDEESDEESDDDAISRFAKGARRQIGDIATRVEATHLSSSKAADVVYGRLRWRADDEQATASAYKTVETEKLTLFEDDADDVEKAGEAGQVGMETGALQTGLLGQVPKGNPAIDGLDTAKILPAALLALDGGKTLPPARVKHLGAAGILWMMSQKWFAEPEVVRDEEEEDDDEDDGTVYDEDGNVVSEGVKKPKRELTDEEMTPFERLKKKLFITGGWDDGEDGEGEGKVAGAAGGDDDEDAEDEDAEAEKLAGQLGWRRGQKEVRPEVNEDGDKLYYDEEGNQLEGVAAYAAKLKEDAAARQKTLAELTLLNDKTGSKPIGAFVRIVISGVPAAWVQSYTLKRPVVVGGLLPGESKLGMMQCKVRKHRWTPRVLKNGDPLLFSIGWRRFQSIPTYCMEDRNQARIKMLKYTPEHLHCLATLYGPMHPPNTGLLAVRQWGTGVHNFRVSLTGSVIAAAANFTVVKKIKLVGEPVKIMKHTAYIKGMFNSSLEVAKCIGSRIETVSGIRGQIKKADGNSGHFRATFEDKILLSDIVVMKAWTSIEPKQFYNPVLDVQGWRRIRTIAELRHAFQEPVPFKHDSSYQSTKAVRVERKFGATKIPKSIASNLPFASRQKNQVSATATMNKKPDAKERQEMAEETKAIKSEYESRVAALMNKLETVRADRERTHKKKLDVRMARKAKVEEKIEEKREAKRKELKKQHYRKEGKVQEAKRRKLRLGDE